MKNYSWLLIILFVGFLFLAIWGFTRIAIWPTWNLSASGQIGDTIGGITAPFINLLGAILVYLSFKQQQEANRIQNQALKDDREKTEALNRFDQLTNMINDIEYEFEKFSVKTTVSKFTSLGALNVIASFYKNNRPTNSSHTLVSEEQVAHSYWNFCVLIAYVADGVDQYNYDLNSQYILKIKFTNVISKFDHALIEILGATRNGVELEETAIRDISQEVVKKIDRINELKLKGFLFW